MDDMNAFERLVAGRTQYHAGPVRRVNDAAIFIAITATESPKWRFQSMFSATKFVVAGAIVALFGGFLLAGVLTQPSNEVLPPAAASASASSSPDATADAAPERSVRSDILPGVDLEVEEVEPGAFRVVSDGVRELEHPIQSEWASYDRFERVVAGYDGSVWIFGQDEFYKLGDAESQPSGPVAPNNAWRRGSVDPDGVLWVSSHVRADSDGRLYSYADGEWELRRGRVSGFAMQPDGTVWVIRLDLTEPGEPTTSLERLEADGWTSFEGPDTGTIFDGPEPSFYDFMVGPGTQEWVDENDDPDEVVDYVVVGPEPYGLRGNAVPASFASASGVDFVGPVDVGAAGDMWLYQVVEMPLTGSGAQRTDEVPFIVHAKLGGGVVATYGVEDGVPRLAHEDLGRHFRSGPDGRVWMTPAPSDGRYGCDGIASFDGTNLTRHLPGLCVDALDISPDGAAWVRAGPSWTTEADPPPPTNLYVIAPEAVITTE